MQSNIKRGITMFSFWSDYLRHTMTLQDGIATAAQLDIPGIELVGAHMVPDFPNPPDTFFEQWHGWMEQYGRTPVCFDMLLATAGPDGRAATEEDVIAAVIRDLKMAGKMGCTVMRLVVRTPPSVMEAVAPHAEQVNVRLGLEIQAPFDLNSAWIQSHLEVMERLGSPLLGFIPDMSMFTKRYPRVMRDRFVRDGAHEQIADHIVARYDSHAGLAGLEAEVRQLGGNDQDLALAQSAQNHIYANPRDLLAQMPRIFHVHAKSFEMLPDGTEYSFPYDELIPVLVEGGYNGYLSTEYEGFRFTQDAFEVDSVGQVRQQQVLFKRLLGEA